MDWLAISHILGDRNNQPIVAVDRTGSVRLLNHAMEQALGWSRLEAEGAPWQHLFSDEVNRWLPQAMRGTLRRYEVVVRTRHGTTVMFQFDVFFVGRGEEEAVLLVAERMTPIGLRAISRRNPGACPWKNAHAALFARMAFTYAAVSAGGSCSNE